MYNASLYLMDACIEQLETAYLSQYGNDEPLYRETIIRVASLALENIANSDALYHDMEHTILVTLAGQEILRGKHLREGGVSARDWLHVVVALLCHDIGYVRGICQGDHDGRCATGIGNQTVMVKPGATDAFLTPYHVDRGIQFIEERFGTHPVLDAGRIMDSIERTRFPVPLDREHVGVSDAPGLVRAADLIGQLADPHLRRKQIALFHEFVETGAAASLGYNTPDDLRQAYPTFYRTSVSPYIRPALDYLRVTADGKQWIANLYANVFAAEHS